MTNKVCNSLAQAPCLMGVVFLVLASTCMAGKRLPMLGANFDEQTFQGLVSTTFQEIVPITQQEVVFFIGPTGVGKSTAVNYFLGRELMIKKESDEPVPTNLLGVKIDVSDTSGTYAPIGHSGLVSATAHPQCYTDARHHLVYVDSPGLFDTHGLTTQTAISLGLTAALQQAQAVKALVFVMGMAEITANRSQIFLRVADTITQVLKTPQAHQQSIFFLFTKEATHTLDVYKRVLKKVAKDLQKTQDLPSQDKKKIAQLLAQMLDNFNQCCFTINPLDGGGSGQLLIDALRHSPVIPKEALGFAGDSQLKKTLVGHYHTKAEKGHQMYQDTLAFPDKIKADASQIETIKTTAKAIIQKMESFKERTSVEDANAYSLMKDLATLEAMLTATRAAQKTSIDPSSHIWSSKIQGYETRRPILQQAVKTANDAWRARVTAEYEAEGRRLTECVTEKEALEKGIIEATTRCVQIMATLAQEKPQYAFLRQIYPYFCQQDAVIENFLAVFSA